MKKSIFLPILLLATSLSLRAEQKATTIDKSIDIFTDVLRQLDLYYVDTINCEQLTKSVINQVLRKLDPYTIYYSEQDFDEYKLLVTGKYGGVGAIITQLGDYVYISEPYENMPAALAGLKAGDKILSIDGRSMKNKKTAEVSSLLKGVPGTELTIKIERIGENKPLTFKFSRQDISLPVITLAKALPTEAGNLGYIAYNSVINGSASEFKQALINMNKQQKLDALVIDLRGNGGGLITEAIDILELFLPAKTEVMSTRGKNKEKNKIYHTDATPIFPDLPIAVLVNRNTASSAEIIAGSLQDLDRATIIGERTFGKGLVQTTQPIAHGGNIKITTSKYYIPSGRCIQAIDYLLLREDGSISKVPDSLTHEFKTAKGRIVRDGGGILPDIVINDTVSKIDICYTLFTQQMFFKFANQYQAEHSAIPELNKFEVDDEMISQFEQFLLDNDFKYRTETSKFYDDMLQMAQHEDIDSTTLQRIEELKPFLSQSIHDALSRQKENVQKYLGDELVTRYYYQKGSLEYQLRFDLEFRKAVEILKK